LYKYSLKNELTFSEVGQVRVLTHGIPCTVFSEMGVGQAQRILSQTDPEPSICCVSACAFHAQPDSSAYCHPPGDEGGESELLGEDLPLEPSVAKAERSHLIVWQVMYGSE